MKTDRDRIEMPTRRGVIAPIVAISLLVIMGGVAIVLDRLWLGLARVELRAGAECAALAAARQLACDDLLRTGGSNAVDIDLALAAAGNVALLNQVAGVPLQLNLGNPPDVLLGVLVDDDTALTTQFVETTVNPTTALVVAKRTRASSNPVSLFLQGLTRQPAGDVVASAEATVDNRIVGIRPVTDAAAPLLPMAILGQDPAGSRTDTWLNQIENRNGPDNYGYDPNTGQVSTGADGIPEIVLITADADQAAGASNLMLLNFGQGQGSGANSPIDQIANGVNQADLQLQGGALNLAAGTLLLQAKGTMTAGEAGASGQIVGQCRVCLLYETYTAPEQGQWGQVQCTGLVAGRVLNVSRGEGNAQQIVFQPGVLATRSALLAIEVGLGPPSLALRNKYLYKLTLTQ